MEAYKCVLAVSGGECSGVDYYIPTSLEDQGRIIVHTTPSSQLFPKEEEKPVYTLPSPPLSSLLSPPLPPLPPDCAVHYTVPAWQIAVPTVVVAVLLGIMLIVGIKLCVVFYVSWAALIVAHFSAVLQYAPHHNQWIYVGLLGVPKMTEADCGGGPQHGTTALYLC